MAVLYKGSDGLGGVDDLEGVQWRRKRCQYVGLIHRQINAAKLQQRMSARQQTLGDQDR